MHSVLRLPTVFMEEIEDDVALPDVDILFAPHHGRKSGRPPASWLTAMDPKVIVVGEAPAAELEYYNEYNTITQNTAGDITFDCVAGVVHVYVSSSTYFVSFLEDRGMSDTHGSYIGSFDV